MGKFAAVILAAAGGFIAGILLAPKDGKATRQDIQEKTNEYKAKAHESIETIKKGAASIKDELREGGDKVKNIAQDVSKNIQEDAKQTNDSVKKIVK